MNRQNAKALLEKQKKKLRENFKRNMDAEKNLDSSLSGSDVFGPRDQLEYQRILKDIRESENWSSFDDALSAK
jgi:hypothetical protein